MPLETPAFGLNELEFLETDTATVANAVISTYNEVTGRTLTAADPVRLFLLSIADILVSQRKALQLAARSNLLSYATGDYLDHLGVFVNTTRKPAAGAITTLRFTLESAAEGDIFQIPAGTQVSNGAYVFATDELATIAVGDTYADVIATATATGEDYNGLAVGSINKMISPIAGVASVENLDEPTGGADTEEDEAYRERIRLAPASFSVAGPVGAYEYHTKSFSASIIDASIYGIETEPGNVYVHPLLTDGTLPESAFLSELKEYLSADTIRPLTDFLIVTAPTAVNYSINFKWYLDTDDLDQIDQIKEDVAAAVETYRLWQQSKIGRDINPDELTRLVKEAGAKRLEITSPVFTTVGRSEVAQCSTDDVTVELAGQEEG